jgi:hypothetical protein
MGGQGLPGHLKLQSSSTKEIGTWMTSLCVVAFKGCLPVPDESNVQQLIFLNNVLEELKKHAPLEVFINFENTAWSNWRVIVSHLTRWPEVELMNNEFVR